MLGAAKSTSWLEILGLGLAIFILYSACLLAWRLHFSPLAKYPGPKIAAATLWYEFYFDWIQGGQFFKEIDRMHSVYGPVIRINPYELHIKDPSRYDELFAASSRRRDKYDWFVGKASGNSVFGSVAADLHHNRRAALNKFFSRKSIADIEPVVQNRIETLCETFKNHISSGGPVELHMAYMALSLDIISYHAFGRSLDLLNEPPSATQKWKTAIQGLVQAAVFARHFPLVGDLLMKLPLSFVKATGSPAAHLLQHREDIKAQVKNVLAGNIDGDKTTRTLFEEMLKSNLPPQEKSIDRLVDEGLVVMSGGGEPTAQTLAVLSFHVLNNPDVLSKLRAELVEAMPDPYQTLPCARLERLSYLRAVILESHRIAATFTARLIRVAPNETMRFGEWEIAPGIPTGMSPHFVHLSADYFPAPHEFKPERWLPGSRIPGNEKYLTPFAKGTRQCIGLNLANVELYMTTATIFRRFTFELFDTTAEDVTVTWDAFVGQFPLESKGVRVCVLRDECS